MNETELLRTLAEAARKKPAPFIDVVDAVRRRVAAEGRTPLPGRFWPIALGLGVAAAASVAIAVNMLAGYAEPFAELLLSMEEALI
jgi:hypothetical protein